MINTFQSQAATFALNLKPDVGTGSVPRRVLDALALLLVREHEVTAVVSSRSLLSTLDLLVSSSPNATAGKTTQHDVIATANPRPHDGQSVDKADTLHRQSIELPDIVAPTDSTTLFQEDPIAYVLNHWQSQTFQDHAGTVIRILNTVIRAESQQDSTTRLTEYLTPYVVLKSSPKILRRLVASYSKPFWGGLSSVTSEHLDTLAFTKPYQLTLSQMNRDKAFLLVVSGEAQRYLRWIAVSTPRLLEVSAQATNGELGNHTFYSAITCGEVHTLLLALLSDLKDYTSVITFLTSLPKNKFGNIDAFKDTDGDKDEEIGNRLNNCVIRVGICLQLLWLLINSYAVEAHIDRIHPVLLEYTRNPVLQEGAKTGEGDCEAAADDYDELDCEDAGNEGVDLNKVELDRPVLPPLVASCMSWLRLLVSHYEAIHTLGKACWKLSQARGGSASTLSIRVVANPHPGQDMQPWKELVTSLAPTLPSAVFTSDMVIAAIDTFMATSKSSPPPPPANAGRKKSLPTWYTNSHFSGTQHCEAGLASLIDNEEVNANIRAAFLDVDKSAIGVSKRCCPVCTRLLGYLFPNDRMDICGTHRTVYPCSLPPWLPQDIVEKMVRIYKDELRTILHDLVKEHHGSRRPSGDSKAASIHSVGSGLGQIETNAAAVLWAKAKGVEWATTRKHIITNNRSPLATGTPASASIEPLKSTDQDRSLGTVLFDWAATILIAKKWVKKGKK